MGSAGQSRRAAGEPFRGQVLRAAAIVLSRVGFAETNTDGIAREMGCTPSELRSLFEDKHEIIAALAEVVSREADELFLITLPDELDIVEKLRHLLVHQAEWGNRWQAALSFFGGDAHRSRRQWLDLDQQYLDGTVLWFKRHRLGEELDLRVPLEVAAYVFRAIQIGFYERWVSRGGGESFLKQTDMVLDVFLNGVCQKAPPSDT